MAKELDITVSEDVLVVFVLPANICGNHGPDISQSKPEKGLNVGFGIATGGNGIIDGYGKVAAPRVGK
jgi:hypothetical protein